MGFLLLGLVIGMVFGWLIVQNRQKKTQFLSTNEYWVYLPGDQMPDQTQVMTRLMGENPYKQGGRSPIGPKEGLLLSDIRLHLALVLRRKNPHVFRPDLFDETVEPTAEILERLGGCESLVKVRYISEQPLNDRSSVQMLPHLADTVAELGNGIVIYDCIKEELYTREAFQSVLAEHLDLNQADIQVRQVWRRGDQGGWAETRGMRKIGLPELATERMEADERVLVSEVLSEAAKSLWDAGDLPEKVSVSTFGDEFQIVVSPPKERVANVKILRVQTI